MEQFHAGSSHPAEGEELENLYLNSFHSTQPLWLNLRGHVGVAPLGDALRVDFDIWACKDLENGGHFEGVRVVET